MTRHIDPKMIKHNIESQIDRLKDLHSKISDEGEPLSVEDRKVLKMAMLPMFEGAMEEVKFAYLVGNKRFFDDNAKFMNQFQTFMD